jgi:hypothetical protein
MSAEEEKGIEEARAERSLRDVWFGFGVAAASAAFMIWVIPAAVVSPTSVEARPLDPRFLPYAISALVGALGALCGLQALLGPGVPKEAGEGFALRRRWPGRLVALALVLGAYFLLPERVGMLPVAVGATALLIWLEAKGNLRRDLGIALLMPVAVYLFFVSVAQVPLPAGVLTWLE